MSTKRILFVDDERRILDGLRRMLRTQRGQWDMEFVEGGEAALEAMAKEPFDVLVTDMRMPGMDGAELLERVQGLYPGIVRIVLSGHAELEAVVRAVPVTHQYLSKPCDPKTLVVSIERACQLHTLLEHPRLRKAIGGIQTLPSLPRVYHALTAALVDPEVGIDRVASIIEQDMGLSAKVLQLVNSSMFGTAVEIESLHHAATVLGTSTLRRLTLAAEVFTSPMGEKLAISMEAEQTHATKTAHLAARIAGEGDSGEQAYVAGLLHDVGKLVLATCLPDTYAEILADPISKPWASEKKILGVTHAELGAYLLGLWGMPYSTIEAVAHHHWPSRVRTKEFGILGAVHVANALINEYEEGGRSGGTLDERFVTLTGRAEQLPEWRAMAAELYREDDTEGPLAA